MAKQSPTQKAMKELRGQGWIVEKVEQRLPIPNRFVTRDLFQCLDLVAMKDHEPLLGLQVTSRTNVNARMTKAKVGGKAIIWVSTGNRFEIWGYAPNGSVRKVVLAMTGEWCGVLNTKEHV
jgi:hypothetical protein